VHTPWFAQSSTALESIMGHNVWTTSGTMMLFYLATLQSIPTDVYEAAAIDGTSRWRTFWKITFPLLKPGHFFVAVVSIIGALQQFDQSFIVGGTSGGPNYSTMTVVLYLYNRAFSAHFGYAAAVGLVLFVFIFTVTLIQRLLFGKAEVA
jgi:ABC-type sugar transport system permease subunit